MTLDVESFDEVSDRLGEVSDRISSLESDRERDHGRLVERVEVLESRFGDIEDDDTTDELSRKVQRLQDRVARLEQQRTTDAAEPADLESWEVEDTTLAQNAWNGQRLASQLLNEARRQSLEVRLQNIDQARESVATSEDAVIKASRQLANAPRDADDAEQQEARKAYERAKGTLNEARRRLTTLQGGFPGTMQEGDAREKLSVDTRKRAKHGATIDAASRDAARLYDRVRKRLDAAITSGAALPVWFTTVLGPTPPAEDTEHWLDTAIQVIVYRITYDITDPVIALGPKPNEHADQLQRDTYALVNEALSYYRR